MDEKTVPQSPHLSLTHTKGYRAWFIADTSISVGMTLRGFAIPLIAYSLSGKSGAGRMGYVGRGNIPSRLWLFLAVLLLTGITGEGWSL